ncbi:MAG: ATP-binding protein, partial [Gemmatimonadaceae bacterium]
PSDDAWFTYSLSPIREEDGTVVALLNVASETTNRIHAERAMSGARADAERAELRLREVFSQAPGFLAVLTGPEHVFEFANPSYLQLVGHRTIIGRSVLEALPEVVGQGFVELLDTVYANAKSFIGREVGVMLEHVRGEPAEEHILDFVYQPITDADGKTTGIVVHGTDVTEASRARREAEASEARYRFLANAIPVQVWTATPDGQLDYASERATQYLGVRDEQLLGEAWLSSLHPGDVSDTIARWGHALETGEPYEVEFRLRNSSANEYRWHLSRATAQRDESGAIIRWFGTNTDIEDRRRNEAKLERLSREATEANRAKSDFLAAMSHELRTPLNAIGGYAQLIELGLRGPVTEEQRVDLLKIQRSKDHLDALVSDVLNFAKAGVGRIDYRVGAIAIAKTLEAVGEMVAPQINEKQLAFQADEVPADLRAIADEDRTRQILLNLLANALKFTPAGGTIAVRVGASDSEVSIAVSDTGIGIPSGKLEEIFQPFVQAERALRPSDQGVGLGLAISRQLARAMGGDLRVESELARGSRFTLTLPRAQ